MPANVETMAYTEARGVPWHGIGTQVKDLMTAEEAIAAAELDWAVDLQPIQTVDGQPINFKRAVVRDTDQHVLGVVGMGYEPVQNAQAFEFADALVADSGNHFETAGSLDGGRTVFLSVELNAVEPIKVEGDSPVDTFLLLANAHDGSKSLRATVTPVRVVCANTLNFALSGAKNVFNIRHSGDVASKMDAAREALDISVDYMRRFEEVADALLKVKVTDKRAKAVVRDVFAMRKETEDKGVDSEWFVKHHATQALDVYESSDDLQDLQGTGWGLVNGVAEYIDHVRTYGKGSTDRVGGDIKMQSLMWGQGADVLNRTVALIDPKVATMMSARTNRAAAKVAVRVR